MSAFQERVLEAVVKVPRGKVTTYKELARAVGRPRAWRAVANVLAGNPHPVKIPCHRVVRSDGGVGGYKLGVKRKIELLSSEAVEINKRKVRLSRHLFRF
ncbi:MAG: MGMT family protein [Candidatus Hadarchaeota archaeon]